MSPIFSPPAGLCAYLASDRGEVSCLEVREVLALGQSPYQSYAVLDTVPYGRVLVLDNVIQSAEYDEWAYHESFVIPSMTFLEQPRRIAVLGGGEGAMAREVLRHPSVEEVTMVDIDQEVVEVCRRHLPSLHGGAFDDRRLTLLHEDARGWLEWQAPESFDVVFVDLTEPLAGGPSSRLFTKEFYALCHRALAPGGVMALQAGSVRPGFSWAYARVVRTLEAVFACVVPYASWITSFAEPWGFVSCGDSSLAALDGALVDQRLATRELTPRFLDGQAFEGARRLPLFVRLEIAAEQELATDERPLNVER